MEGNIYLFKDDILMSNFVSQEMDLGVSSTSNPSHQGGLASHEDSINVQQEDSHFGNNRNYEDLNFSSRVERVFYGDGQNLNNVWFKSNVNDGWD